MALQIHDRVVGIKKKNAAGRVNGPHRFSLRGSDYDFSRSRKNLRTLAHARKGQALRRAQRGDLFTPRTKNSLYMGIEPGRGGATGRPRPTSDLRRVVGIKDCSMTEQGAGQCQYYSLTEQAITVGSYITSF